MVSIVRLLRERAGTPLLFTGNPVVVAVHPSARAIAEEEFCLCAGRHLRAVRASVASEALRSGLRHGDGFRRRHQRLGWRRGHRSPLPVLVEAEHTQRQKKHEAHHPGQQRAARAGFRAANSCAVDGAADGFALYVHRPRLTGLAAPKLVRQFLADCGPRPISWQG